MKALTYVEVDVKAFGVTNRAVNFNGTTTYLTRGAGLTGAADSKLCTFSYWINSSTTGTQIITGNTAVGGGVATNGTRVVLASGTRQPSFVGHNSAGTIIINFTADSALPDDGEWHHVICSIDMDDQSKVKMFVDGVEQTLTFSTFTGGSTIDFTYADWSVGANTDGSTKITGSLADVWFKPGTWLDLSSQTVRGKFRNTRGSPVYLGVTGNSPTGSAPILFLSGDATAWHTNKGTGEGFTLNGGAFLAAPEFSEIFRFTIPTSYLPMDIDAIPSVKSVSFKPASVSLGEDLGVRASIDVMFSDHLHKFGSLDSRDTGTFWGKWRGFYGVKLRGRPIRIYRGILGQSLDQMEVRHYIIDTTDGPTPAGVYTITAKDVLKLADDDRAQAPILSNGSLAGSIDNVTTSATLSPAGIGNLEYPASGHLCFGGKEVVSFTRAADVLTITRGQLGTSPISHTAGDRIQLVLRYAGNDVADIIYDLLTNYTAGIDPAWITLSEWQAETAANLGTLYAATLTEPIGVKKLISEIINQAALAVWWDDQAQKIRLKVLKEISTDAETFDEDRIIASSLSVKESPDRRISQLWTYFGQRDPTDQADNEDNYRAALATVDLVLEGEYGSPALKKITGRWLPTLSAAERLGQIQISRFRDPPRQFGFTLFRDQVVALGQGYQLRWANNQDEFGVVQPAPIQITKVKYEADYVHIEAEEMLASGVVVLTNTVLLTDTSGLLSWVVPATWNDADNSIETLGGGAGGDAGGSSVGGKGGGGGAYSKVENVDLTPSASISYRVGIGGDGGFGIFGFGGALAVNGGDTWFNGASLAASTVGSKGGQAGLGRTNNGQGGQASAGVGILKTSGGDGGNGGNASDERGGGGGGGGCGGPNGDGANGGAVTTDNGSGGGGGAADGGSDGETDPTGSNAEDAGDGGNNRFNFGGGISSHPSGQEGGGGRGGDQTNPSGQGGAGEIMWTQTIAPIISAGPGGGGGGGRENSASNSGADGGPYGGGGGGGGGNSAGGGDGYQGIIAITWREA